MKPKRPAAEVTARRKLRRLRALAEANEVKNWRREAEERYAGREVVLRPKVLN